MAETRDEQITEKVTIDLGIEKGKFSTDRITTPPGADVTLRLENRDSGVAHNFALYTGPASPEPIFSGEPVTGPGSATYTFRAPIEPGTFAFRCEMHSDSPPGTFVTETWPPEGM